MSRKTIKERREVHDHAVKFGGWDPKVEEYFLNAYSSAREPWTLKENEHELILLFFKYNRNRFSDFDKFWEARSDFIKKSGISAQTFDYVWYKLLKRVRAKHKKIKQTKIDR